MKKTIFLILIELLAVGAFAAERVVSLSPALTELVYQLGCGDRLIGRSEACDWPPEVKQLPVAGRFADPFVEKLIRLQPTLLLTNDLVNPGEVRTFTRNGISVEMKQCRTLSEYRDWVTRLGALLDCPDAARRELERVDARSARRPRLNLNVLWVIWDSPLLVAGAGSLADELLTLAGAENVAGKVNQPYFKGSLDWLLDHQPDVIVWTASHRDGLKQHRFWGKLRAVQHDRIVELPDNPLIQRPGPRMFDGIDLLHEKLEAKKQP